MPRRHNVRNRTSSSVRKRAARKRIGRKKRLILKYRRAIARYEKKLDRTIKSAVKDMR